MYLYFLSLMSFVFLCLQLHAGTFEDTFKKALHKSDCHYISGINYIYMINRKNELSHFRAQKKSFSNYEIFLYRFDAVNPDLLGYRTLSKIGVKGKYAFDHLSLAVKKCGHNYSLSPSQTIDDGCAHYSLCMDQKDIARNLDILSIIFDAYKSKKNTIWIMEDNVTIVADPNVLTGYLIALQRIDAKWDVLYTDPVEKIKLWSIKQRLKWLRRPDIDLESSIIRESFPSTQIVSPGMRMGSYSIIISRTGMKKILDYYHKHHFFIPVGTELGSIPNLNCYATIEPVVTCS